MLNVLEAGKRGLLARAHAPVYSAFVTLVSLFAGLLGTLYADDIKGAFPFVLGWGSVSWPALWFWFSAGLATSMFFVAQRASEAARAGSQAELIERTEELSTLVRTLPPADFLLTFQQIFWDCSVALSGILETLQTQLSIAEVQGAIRLVLAGVATLAQKFDGAGPEIIYAANIMLFRPSDELAGEQIQILKSNLRFSPAETDLTALRGLLTLETALSTTTQSSAPQEPDKDLIPLALAIPKMFQTPQGRWRVLPGAPMAFCTGKLAAYVDTHTLHTWCEEEGDFPQSIAAQIEEYFKSERAQRARSFISIPLKAFEGETVGILNIHRNQTGILAEKEPLKQYELAPSW